MPQEGVGLLVALAPEVGGAEAHWVNCTRTGRVLTLRGCGYYCIGMLVLPYVCICGWRGDGAQ
jgi:hypothetical protein